MKLDAPATVVAGSGLACGSNGRGSKRPAIAALAVGAVGLAMAGAANAHFQILYTPETALSNSQAVSFLMVFSHPAHGGPSMEMADVESFYVVAQRGDDAEPVKTDLKTSVQPIQWHAKEGTVRGYEAKLPRNVTRSLGDYVFALTPGPYYEGGEDKYIQQFTKTMVNVGGVPGNWSAPLGLPAEIIPLDKPYANWTGGVFRGVVTADGKPVPNAAMEIEYINYAVDVANLKFGDKESVVLPQGSFGTMGIRANANGEFTIGLPRAGWWGICALAVGPKTEYKGKKLSQDAVLWVQVKDMK